MHFKQYSMLAGNILGHTVLLAVWLGIEFSFDHWVVPLFPIGTLTFYIAFTIAKLLFLLLPLGFILVWMRRDLLCAWYQTQREIAEVQAAAKTVEEIPDVQVKPEKKIRIPLTEERQSEKR
jgi:hypothetical protein